MFEIIQNRTNTQIKTDRGVYVVRYSSSRRRYQVSLPQSKAVFSESTSFQGTLDFVDQHSR